MHQYLLRTGTMIPQNTIITRVSCLYHTYDTYNIRAGARHVVSSGAADRDQRKRGAGRPLPFSGTAVLYTVVTRQQCAVRWGRVSCHTRGAGVLLFEQLRPIDYRMYEDTV